MSHLRTIPVLLFFAACAHCDSGSGRSPAEDAGAKDASISDAVADATLGDANKPADGSSPEDAARNDATAADAAQALPKHTYVYVGGYGSDPVRIFEINRTTLALTPVSTCPAGPQPTYLTPSRDGRFLYAANESNGKPGITVLSVDPATGIADYADKADDISGDGYVFTALDPSGKYVLAASYNGGNVGVYSLNPDGHINMRVDAESFGANAQTHSVRVHPSGKWAYVPNKGLDNVAQFSFNGATGALTASGAFTRAGFDGPRHIAFSPDAKLAFVILELADQLASFTINQSNGALVAADQQPRLPASYSPKADDKGAHVLAHPNGKYVYGSNRGSNTIAAFSYDAQGKLTLLEHEATRGETPRNFDIDPYGQFMVVANQNSGNMAVFAIEADGRLSPKGELVTGLGEPAALAIVGF